MGNVRNAYKIFVGKPEGENTVMNFRVP